MSKFIVGEEVYVKNVDLCGAPDETVGMIGQVINVLQNRLGMSFYEVNFRYVPKWEGNSIWTFGDPELDGLEDFPAGRYENVAASTLKDEFREIEYECDCPECSPRPVEKYVILEDHEVIFDPHLNSPFWCQFYDSVDTAKADIREHGDKEFKYGIYKLVETVVVHSTLETISE